MQNIILTGFMGTGKTTVGAILASMLQCPLVDIDQAVVAMEGREIAEIFAEEGEGYFRRLESQALAEALQGEGKVIATGGGALLNNRDMLHAGGLLFCLTAPPKELVKRLRAAEGRPLLTGGDPEGQVRALLEERAGIYGQVSRKIDTGGKTPMQVASEIVGLLALEKEI